jgi:hypothetical protein
MPAAASGGSNACVCLANAYQKVRVTTRSQDSTGSWSYNTATWRAADASNSNRISYVDPLGQTSVEGAYTVSTFQSGTGGRPQSGIDRDSTSASPFFLSNGEIAALASGTSQTTAVDSWSPSIGFHFLQAVEFGNASGTVTWIGSSNMNLVAHLDQ